MRVSAEEMTLEMEYLLRPEIADKLTVSCPKFPLGGTRVEWLATLCKCTARTVVMFTMRKGPWDTTLEIESTFVVKTVNKTG